ncbi:MAG: hypothetical protein LBD24_04315 [Spirochaetaceae bacterium]|nr:hypothetical protein [Spirochaetaceae bacterium]
MSAERQARGTPDLRRKSPWEGADAGLLLWRENLPAILLFFGVPLALAASVSRTAPEWSYIVLWWLKPLFGRLVLHVVSTRFFEPRKSLSGLFAGLGRRLVPGLAGDLLWRRFSLRRSAVMPIRVLEGLRGARYARRKRVLGNGGLGFSLLVTLTCLGLEVILLAGEFLCFIILLKLFRPDYFSSFTGLVIFIEETPGIEAALFTAYTCNMLLIESLYVCMGFGLYLNSRIEVEGWDLEILLRPPNPQPPAVP